MPVPEAAYNCRRNQYLALCRLGSGADREKRRIRALKEAVHELGHTFGLLHCETTGCVMTRSVNLIDVDAKAMALCGPCEARYRELREKDGHHEQGTHTHPRR